jgi:2-C-methyl-D-erythritol 4-phosphate cytidylyltransferase
MEMGKNYAVILAGGSGLRAGSAVPKQFVNLSKKPVILWSIDAFDRIKEINKIIIVSHKDFIPWIEKRIKRKKTRKSFIIIPGGPTRQESSLNAVKSMEFRDDDILIFHDAARPFVSRRLIIETLNAAKIYGASAAYIPLTDTVAEISGLDVKSIPQREKLFRAQTPQAFRHEIIKKAHGIASSGLKTATDDVALVLNAGYKIRMVSGDPANIKITTAEDFLYAKILIRKM